MKEGRAGVTEADADRTHLLRVGLLGARTPCGRGLSRYLACGSLLATDPVAGAKPVPAAGLALHVEPSSAACPETTDRSVSSPILQRPERVFSGSLRMWKGSAHLGFQL